MTTEKTLSERLVELSAFYAERPAVNQEFRSPEMVEISMRECADLHVILKEAATALSGRVSDADMAAFGASEYAAYKYPGEHQVAERAAFCEGAALQASLPARGVTENDLGPVIALALHDCPHQSQDMIASFIAKRIVATLPASGGNAVNNWFELTGDARLGRCATEDCAGQPTFRLEAVGVGSNYCSGCRAKIQALSAPTGWRVPEGWQLVPKEPTDEQYEAVSNMDKMWKDNNSTDVYRAMVAAAPPPPASKSASDTTPQEQGNG